MVVDKALQVLFYKDRQKGGGGVHKISSSYEKRIKT
jgi:hypothetical protein